MLVSDGAGVFRANQAKAVYRPLGIRKETIEKRKPWQNFVETTFNVQRRMADHHFAKAESWEELVAAHDRWVEQYNTQKHWAHRERKDARRSPAEVLGFLTGVRHRKEDLERAFFSTRFARILDSSGYARLKHWRVYGEEGLARREVALWLGPDALSVEFAGDTLARYDVEYSARTDRLREVKSARLFETVHRVAPPQPRLFELGVLGESGWLKALKMNEYALRKPHRPPALQEAPVSFLVGSSGLAFGANETRIGSAFNVHDPCAEPRRHRGLAPGLGLRARILGAHGVNSVEGTGGLGP